MTNVAQTAQISLDENLNRFQNDAHLLSIIEDLLSAKAAATAAKEYLDDYMELTNPGEGDYRCGQYVLKVRHTRRANVTLAK